MRATLFPLLSILAACVQTSAQTGADSSSSDLDTDACSSNPESSSEYTNPSETETETDTETETSANSEDPSTDTDDTGDELTMPECPEDLITYVAPMGFVEVLTESDLDPLIGVQCLEGSLWINDIVPTLAKLESLEVIVGDLDIDAANGPPHLLTSLEGLENLTYVYGGVQISSSSLVSLAGLEALTEVEGAFTIRHAYLQNVDPLAQLNRAGALILGYWDGGGPWIEQIEGLSGLTEVQELFIQHTTGLTSLAGLENLELAGSIFIYDNLNLVDVTPLGGGKPIPVPNGLSIVDNWSLPTCNAWALANSLNVQGVEVSGNVPDACGD